MSFPPYQTYKETGTPWLGKVPDHWQLSPIKRTCRFFGGGTPSRDNLGYWGGNIPWVSPKDMKSELIAGTEECITADALTDSPCALVDRGAVLLVVRSGILKHTIPVALNIAPVTLNQDMKALRFDGRCNPMFFLRWVQGLNDQLLAVWSKQGATVESIEHEYLANTMIALPSPAEQASIATFLDRETSKIDSLIDEQKRLIDLLKEKRQAVISHAVTKGLNPYAPMKDSGIEWLGMVPAHWEVGRVGMLFTEAVEEGVEDLPILSVSIHDGVSDKELADDELDRKVTRSEDRSKYKRVRRGDLVYNMMRAWQGGFGSVTVDGMVSPAYVVCRPRVAVESVFLEAMLRVPTAVEEMRRHSKGITDFRLRLYWDNFKNIGIAIPPLDEQKQLVDHIQSFAAGADALMSECEQSVQFLQERRSALISAAVTGKIDVRGLVKNETQARAETEMA